MTISTTLKATSTIIESEKPSTDEFSFYLNSMREILELSKLEMAVLLGCNKNSYLTYENGTRVPSKWESFQNIINDKVKEHFEILRNTPQYATITEQIGEEILSLHFDGYNVVRIGMKLEIDEDEVSDFITSKGEEPISFTLFD